MKVKVNKEFELHSNHIAREGDILNLIAVNYDYENENLYIVLEKHGHIFNIYFKDEFDANEHIEFDYKEEINSAEVYISENESNRRVAEVYDEQQKKIEYWKSKCMKLIEMI